MLAGFILYVLFWSDYSLGGCPRIPFRPNSSEFTKNYAHNIKRMDVFAFRA